MSKTNRKYSNEELELFDDAYFKKTSRPRTRYSLQKLSKMKKNMVRGGKKFKDDVIYNEAKEYLDANKDREIILHEGEVQVIPTTDSRQCLYVAGPSGAGKSTWVSKYVGEYKKMYPKHKVYLFSRVSNDTCLDDLNPIRIIMDNELIDDPIDPKELKKSIVIFDDTDTIPNDKLRKAMIKLKNDLLETGRHEDIYVIITSHLITNYKETRTILNECHLITLFPHGGSSYGIKQCLERYCGIDKKNSKKILNLPSRWVTIKKSYPQAVIYEKGLYLL